LFAEKAEPASFLSIVYRSRSDYTFAMSKTFTLEEVNRLLPDVDHRFTLICEKRAAYLRVHDAIFVQELAHSAEKKGADLFDADLEKDIQNLETIIYDLAKEIDALIELGCVLRSIDQGLIDFPGQHHGERLFFSWKKGEKEIGFIRRRVAGAASADRIALN